jgi:tetratricopeptide (TPR) repeat protein
LTDIHVTRELLRAVARGDVPPRLLAELGLQHLTALCPHCREEYLAWRKEQSGTVNYDMAFLAIPALFERHGREMERKEKAARRDLRDLLYLPFEARLVRIRRANTRFRGTALAGLLLEESRKRLPGNPQRVAELAETAMAVLHYSPAGPDVPDLAARAAAYLGNACRASGNLQDARKRFEHARYVMKHEGVTDPIVCAEVDWHEGSLLADQRRFAEAGELLARSITFYTLGGDRSQAAFPMLTLGLMRYHQGDFAGAVEVTRAAVDLLPAAADARFHLYARHNLSLYLCEAGRYDAAADAALANRGLYERFPDAWTQLRRRWLEGKIAAGRGEWAAAEEAFLATRDGFVRQRNGYDAAMVTLDLALLYAKQGRSREIRQLAEEMHPIFEAEDVHREAVAALLLFQDAARQETLTVEVLEEVTTYLRVARADPSLRFREGA